MNTFFVVILAVIIGVNILPQKPVKMVIDTRDGGYYVEEFKEIHYKDTEEFRKPIEWDGVIMSSDTERSL